MRPTIPTLKYDLVEPIGVGTGLVEASSSLWKRAAERASVRFADLLRWALDRWPAPPGITAEYDRIQNAVGIDGQGAVAEVYLGPLRSLVASERIEACTLLPFAGLLSEKRLLHRYRVWCPMCLASMLSGPAVYEPLFWRLQVVKVCPVHRVDLAESCHVCMAPRQRVLGSFARVGCCNRCGAWLGAKEAVRRLLPADAYEIKVSRAIMNLLAWTAGFERRGHEGWSTLRKLVAVSAVRELLISTFDLSPATIRRYTRLPLLPQLSVLATVAAVSRQPLRQVILGQVVSWKNSSRSSSRISVSSISQRRNWKSIERKFEKLAKDPACTNVEKACKLVNIDECSARRHFPDCVARIVRRGRVSRLKRAAARKQALLARMRKAFRTLIAAGVYPSFEKIARISGVDTRDIDRDCVKDLLDKEWIRAEEKTHWRRQHSRNPSFNRDRS